METLEPKYIRMINQLRLTNSEEDVSNFLKAVMMHDLAKQHWEQIFKKQSEAVEFEQLIEDWETASLNLNEDELIKYLKSRYLITRTLPPIPNK